MRHPTFKRVGSVLDPFKALSCTEDKRNAPDTGKADDRVDDAGEQRRLSAADPSHNIELEQSDATPVEGADDREYQRNAIHNHNRNCNSFFEFFSGRR